MSKKVAVVQSNYIPWKGYFDLINSVDEFILFDDMQYTVRDWRNRNLIKTPNGPIWLTVPVLVKGKRHQRINETVISDPTWAMRHWKSIRSNYSRAPFYDVYRDFFETRYLDLRETNLSRVNRQFIQSICEILGIKTTITLSSDYQLVDGKTERLVGLCQQAGATEYISGPAAKVYMDLDLFSQAGIGVSFFNYDDYPEYEQLYPPFIHQVSILDLIFNTGPEAGRFMKSFS